MDKLILNKITLIQSIVGFVMANVVNILLVLDNNVDGILQKKVYFLLECTI